MDGTSSTSSTSRSRSQSLLSATMGSLQSLYASILSNVHTGLDTIFPPPQRAAAKSHARAFAHERPFLASFLLSHLVFSGIPILLFTLQGLSILLFSLATALLVASLCALAFTAVCIGVGGLILLPVLLVTGFLGFAAWCWVWMGWYVLKWMGVVEPGAWEGQSGSRKSGIMNREKKEVKKENTSYGNGTEADGVKHAAAY